MNRPLGYVAKDFDKFKWFKSHRAECVHEGWYTLLYKLCLAIDKELANVDKSQFVVITVKQKFGGLRVYLYGGNEAINDLVHQALVDSHETCELCGYKGRARPGCWIMTLCTKHWLDSVFGEGSNPRWSVKFRALWDDFNGQLYGVGYLVSNHWARILHKK